MPLALSMYDHAPRRGGKRKKCDKHAQTDASSFADGNFRGSLRLHRPFSFQQAPFQAAYVYSDLIASPNSVIFLLHCPKVSALTTLWPKGNLELEFDAIRASLSRAYTVTDITVILGAFQFRLKVVKYFFQELG